MRQHFSLGICLILVVLSGCAAYKPRPVELISMKVLNESFELTHDKLKAGKLAIIPCKNNTEHIEITSLIDSILINELPVIFPQFVSINESFDALVEQRDIYKKTYDATNVKKSNINGDYIFFTEVDSLWNKHVKTTHNDNFNNNFNKTGASWLISILDLKLSIFDQEQDRIIWERKIQSSVSEVENNLVISLIADKSTSAIQEICNQSIKPITVALSTLKLPVELQMELNEINTSKDYNISIQSTIKIFEWIGAEVTKKKFEYKIEFNKNKIYIPLDSKFLTSQNYNDILTLLEECNLYYKKLTK